jgi:hypothetical protein
VSKVATTATTLGIGVICHLSRTTALVVIKKRYDTLNWLDSTEVFVRFEVGGAAAATVSATAAAKASLETMHETAAAHSQKEEVEV